MDAQLIEKQDALRYRFILLKAIGLFCMSGLLVAPGLSGAGRGIQIAVAAIAVCGTILLVSASFRYSRWMAKIIRQPELKNALYNEMYRAYEFNAVGWGFYTFVIAALLLGSTADLTGISARTACYTVLFCGVMATKIAQLILHRK
jgi:hypothetical protein